MSSSPAVCPSIGEIRPRSVLRTSVFREDVFGKCWVWVCWLEMLACDPGIGSKWIFLRLQRGRFKPPSTARLTANCHKRYSQGGKVRKNRIGDSAHRGVKPGQRAGSQVQGVKRILLLSVSVTFQIHGFKWPLGRFKIHYDRFTASIECPTHRVRAVAKRLVGKLSEGSMAELLYMRPILSADEGARASRSLF